VSETQRKAILDEAARDRDLLAQVPAVVAAGFGVLPLRRLGDVLTVACLPGANRRALRLLRNVLGVEIVATPFEHGSLHEAIRAAYFPDDAKTVNFPTFRDADFLDDPRSAQALRVEKVERVGPAELSLAPDRVALVTLCYRSSLSAVDGPRPPRCLPDPRRTRLDLGALDVAWSRRDGAVRLHSGQAAGGDDVRVAVTEFRASDYRHAPDRAHVSEHSVKASFLRSLPHLIHPTEVQLVRVEEDGSLGLHVYDRVERVPPGQRRRLSVSYWFLSYGTRLHRTIDLDVEEVGTVARASVQVHNRAAPWGVSELGRWLGTVGPPQEY
jgi:hypothetical protein